MMRARRRSVAWIAAFAMALHALWPLVAQAKPAQAPHLVALCTVDGTTHYVELPAGGAPAGEQSPAQHCKLCTFGAERAFAPPPAAFVALVRDAPVALPQPALVLHNFASLCLPPAQPRAPPALS
jgi:Protein of unknown function (DUF2946)